MTGRAGDTKLMIMDACVLIDFVKADRLVLRLFVKHLGAVHVISPILDEVREIRHEEEITELGLVVVEPELEDAFARPALEAPHRFRIACVFSQPGGSVLPA